MIKKLVAALLTVVCAGFLYNSQPANASDLPSNNQKQVNYEGKGVWTNRLISYIRGKGIDDSRANPYKALGKPRGSWYESVSLGKGGILELAFSPNPEGYPNSRKDITCFLNSPGDYDLEVVVPAEFHSPQKVEMFDVHVGNGLEWYFLGRFNTKNNNSPDGIIKIDMGKVDLASIVRIHDPADLPSVSSIPGEEILGVRIRYPCKDNM